MPAGFTLSFLCAAIGFVIDRQQQLGTPILISSVNAVARLTVFSLSAYGSWKIRKMGEVLAELSLIDPLTGMNNRRDFLLRGKEEIDRMARNGNPISVLFLDLDNFKTINDTMGHDAGDEVLQITTGHIKRRLRHIDFPARLGGDEFAAILPAADGGGTKVLAADIQAALREAFLSRNFPISASIGIATFLQAPESFEYILKCADSLMYEIKNLTKDAVLQRDLDGSSAAEH